MEEDVKVLKDTAAVMEGLCKRLIEEPDYGQLRFIAQTLLEYCHSFDKGYIRMLARESHSTARVSVSGSPRVRESDGEREPAYFSTSV